MKLFTRLMAVAALAAAVACNTNPAPEKTENQTPAEQQTEPAENPMKAFAGKWVCEEKASIAGTEIQGMKVPGVSASAKITYTLHEDGTFESKGETMGAAASVGGNWKLSNGNVVMNANGETQVLTPNDGKTTLTEQASGMVMTKQ